MTGKIGQKRQFSFVNYVCTIREIIKNTNISMWWLWREDFCPHCKKKIEKRVLHTFDTIEILLPIHIPDEGAKKEDFIILGSSTDGKLLNLTIDKYDEVLSKTDKFKNLVIKEKQNGH